MKLKYILFGSITTIMILLSITMAIAGLAGDSTLLASVTKTDPNDANNWMTCEAWSNTDNTKSFVCTMPNAVAGTLNQGLTKDYETEVIDPNSEELTLITNPQSSTEYALTGPMKYFAGIYRAELIKTHNENKPTGLE